MYEGNEGERKYFDSEGVLLPEIAIAMECDELLDELEWTLDRVYEKAIARLTNALTVNTVGTEA